MCKHRYKFIRRYFVGLLFQCQSCGKTYNVNRRGFYRALLGR